MHAEARAFVSRAVAHHGPFATVVELGALDINGGVRDLFGDADYLGLDLVAGPGVDVVADAADWRPPRSAAAVVCCEVLEHTPQGEDIVTSAYHALAPGGVLILTAACAPRQAHSAIDGGAPRQGEFYRNVVPAVLEGWLWRHFDEVGLEVDRERGDVYALARKEG